MAAPLPPAWINAMAHPGSPPFATAASEAGDDLADLDLGRRQRLGMVEAVWGEHKSADQILEILQRLHRAGVQGLVTRVSEDKAAAVLAGAKALTAGTSCQRAPGPAANNGGASDTMASATNPDPTVERNLKGEPGAGLNPARDKDEDNSAVNHERTGAALAIGYNPEAQLLLAPPVAAPDLSPGTGDVVVVCAGTSDRRVALEAQLCLACHGINCELVVDVGVAGLHRLLNRLEQLSRARVLIACAGMEGALPTVLAGLLPQPVIAVPVSVGYGVSAGGVAALHGMLASCAPGLCVVNIDNGYGAAMAALRILGVPTSRSSPSPA